MALVADRQDVYALLGLEDGIIMTAAAADWYPDPHAAPGSETLRYWDGGTWTSHTHDPSSPAIGTSPPITEVASIAEPVQNSEAPETATDPVPALVDPEPRLAAAADLSPIATTRSSATVARRPIDRKIPTFGAKKIAEDLVAENEALIAEINELQEVVAKYGIADAVQRASALAELESNISDQRALLDNLIAQVRDVDSRLVAGRDTLTVQDVGLFDYVHPAETSAELATELEALRYQIKSMNKIGNAVKAGADITFGDSAAKGRKFTSDMSRIMLRAYNAEAENCIKGVKAGNLATAQSRLSKTVDAIARQGSMIELRVDPSYHRLRLKELELASRHMIRLADEREADREHKAELREQKRAEAELRAEQDRLNKERTHFLNSIAALEANGDAEGVARLKEKLADVDHAIADVDYRAANIRAGYVYVISNVGSLGEGTVKIGMTRRLEPMDRVKELGDASVPFRFDVHALFFSEDAVGVETMLHQQFSEQRMNKINLRREFFKVSPQDVLDALKEHDVEVLEFDLAAAAEEFRLSWPADVAVEPA